MRRTSRAGFTLVEIAVALAIFVIGALAIIQIFPPALNVVRGSERRTIATSLSRDRVSTYENRLQTAPDAIYTTVGGSWVDFKSNITNNALTQTGGINSATIPQGPNDDITQTTIGQFKHIRGEKQTVKTGRIGNTDVFYVLTQFPYANNQVAVYADDTLSGVRVDSNGYLNFSQARSAKGTSLAGTPITSSNPPLLNPPLSAFRDNSSTTDVECEYFVTYRWIGSNGRIQGEVDEPLLIPEDGNASWTASPTPNLRVLHSSGIISGPVTVRLRALLKVVTANVATPPAPPTPPQIVEPTVGLVRVDGLATSGSTVSLDYDVSDWRDITIDEVPSRPLSDASTQDWNVLAPMQNLNPEASIFSFSTIPNPAPGTVTPPVLNGYTWTDGAAPPGAVFGINEVNTGAGRITYHIPPAEPLDPTPTTAFVRTVLRTVPPISPATTSAVISTLDNWGHQLMVAASSYVPYESGQTGAPLSGYLQHPREGWREYAWQGPGNNNIYFQAAESGKLVMVDYEYSTGGSSYQTVHGAILPVSVQDTPLTSPVAGFAPTSGQASYARLMQLDGKTPANVTAITAVRGVSIAARTAWLENGRYSQVVTKGYRPLIGAL